MEYKHVPSAKAPFMSAASYGTRMNAPRRLLNIFAFFLMIAAGGSAKPQSAGETVPAEARKVIDQAGVAARTRDFETLRRLMSDHFKWNLGPDGEDVDLAINAWRRDPAYLIQMSDVLRRGCRLHDVAAIECPGKGGIGFRAGFRKTSAGWCMTHFLAGD
jgi:hypothetical protein